MCIYTAFTGRYCTTTHRFKHRISSGVDNNASYFMTGGLVDNWTWCSSYRLCGKLRFSSKRYASLVRPTGGPRVRGR